MRLNIKYFVLWLAVIAATIVGVDLIAGAIRKAGYKSANYYHKYEYLIRDAEEEIIVIGNSAAEYHFDTKRLTDSIGVTSFNAGDGGTSIDFNIGLLQIIFERYRPELVIFALNRKSFQPIRILSSHEILKPLYGLQSPKLDSLLENHYSEHPFALKSNLWLFNPTLIHYMVYKSGIIQPISLDRKGFQPMYAPANVIGETAFDRPNRIRADIKSSLIELRDLCKAQGVGLIINIIPDYLFPSEAEPYKHELLSIFGSSPGCEVWYDADHPYFRQDASMFHDDTHFIHQLAEIYTDTIANRLKKIYRPKLTK